jgi:hypothetical protein
MELCALYFSRATLECLSWAPFHDERDVWTRLWALVVADLGEPEKLCLTSHTWAEARSAGDWRTLCAEACGADVMFLAATIGWTSC